MSTTDILPMTHPLEKIFDRNPLELTANWIDVSREYEQKGEVDQSHIAYLYALEQIRKSKKEYFEIYSGLGRIRAHLGQIYESIYAIERAKQYSHNNQVNWEDLENVFQIFDKMIFKTQSPFQLLEELHLDKNNPTTWTVIGIEMYYQGRFEDALFCYNRALTLDKNDCNAYKGKFQSLKRMGYEKEAIIAFKKTISYFNTFG